MVNLRKVAVIGCGNVGASIAFHIVERSMFSEMVLIDINKEKTEGEAMDLSHGLPYVAPMEIYAGDYKDIADAAIIIITSGAAQKPGETRLDLVKKNSAIMASIIDQIAAVKPEGILLIVSNPVDVLTHVALKRSGLPKNRVFGSGTVLDTARLKYLLASRLHVDSRNVHTVIIGEHGDTEFPVNSIANVSGIPLYDFFALENQDGYEAMLAEIQEDVRTSAYEIIKKKGATYYGIAMAVGKICRSIVSDEKSMLPVSVELEGEYGLSGLSISVPCIVGKNGVEQILEMPLNVQERRELKKSADSLKKVIASIDQ